MKNKRVIEVVYLFLFTGIFACTFLLFLGDQGILKKNSMQKQLDNKQKVYNAIKKERAKKQHIVSLMYSDNLDLDLLEEQARELFNFIDSNEVVVEDKN